MVGAYVEITPFNEVPDELMTNKCLKVSCLRCSNALQMALTLSKSHKLGTKLH